MTSGVPFTDAQIVYMERHRDEWPSVLTYKLNSLFGTDHKVGTVRKQLNQLKKSTSG
jgi:hypothetical protein